MESPLELRTALGNIPAVERISILVILPGTVAAAVVLFMIIVLPSGIVSTWMWGIVIVFAAIMVGLMVSSLILRTRIRVDANGVTVLQGPFHTTLGWSDLSRAYAFADGRQRRIALVPQEGSFVYLGHALAPEDLDRLAACLRDLLASRTIEFTEGVTFAELWARESSRSPQKTARGP